MKNIKQNGIKNRFFYRTSVLTRVMKNTINVQFYIIRDYYYADTILIFGILLDRRSAKTRSLVSIMFPTTLPIGSAAQIIDYATFAL